MAFQDAPTIAGELQLYRRIPPQGDRVVWVDDKPEPASFNFKDPRQELSFYLANETTPEAALAGHDGFGLVSITASQVRSICPGLIICRDPENPANGHVLLIGKVSGGMALKLKKAASWVEGRWPIRIMDPNSSQSGSEDH